MYHRFIGQEATSNALRPGRHFQESSDLGGAQGLGVQALDAFSHLCKRRCREFGMPGIHVFDSPSSLLLLESILVGIERLYARDPLITGAQALEVRFRTPQLLRNFCQRTM
jgi:hypothetical protein